MNLKSIKAIDFVILTTTLLVTCVVNRISKLSVKFLLLYRMLYFNFYESLTKIPPSV